MSPLRIAIVSDTYAPQVNGVARTLARSADTLLARGHEVRVLTPADPDATEDPVVEPFPSRALWLYPQLRLAAPSRERMTAALASWKPDLVHLATPFGMGLAARRAAKRLGIPMVSSYHTSLAKYAEFYGLGAIAGIGWRFLRWFHNGTRRTLCPTRAIVAELKCRGFDNLSVWGRGIDTDQFNPRWRSDALRTSWGAGSDTVVIALVGRLAAEKGLDVALDAVSELAGERRDVVCVVAGDGPYELECRRRAPAGTVFTGRIGGSTLSEVYASSDVFLFPSTTDTFGNVAQEAMASGLVVIGADVPQTREVLPGDCGLFFRPGDAASLATELRALLDSSGGIARRKARGVAAMANRSWTAVFDGLERDYRDVLAQAHRSAPAPSWTTPTSRGSSARSS
jgi:glycosyltransferase involved in cell wall biosynthesis